MRESRLGNKRKKAMDPDDIATLVPGERVKGYAVDVEEGMFCSLRPRWTPCASSNLDGFVADPAGESPGKLVEGRIVSADVAKRRVEISFRENDATKSGRTFPE